MDSKIPKHARLPHGCIYSSVISGHCSIEGRAELSRVAVSEQIPSGGYFCLTPARSRHGGASLDAVYERHLTVLPMKYLLCRQGNSFRWKSLYREGIPEALGSIRTRMFKARTLHAARTWRDVDTPQTSIHHTTFRKLA